ncbi:MAG: dockerin type I repeat-containing protein [Bacteroidaceae bacterium]|nr:dockerin type I repeat-containing protein [Bacteroidaceae bacterium]
MRKLLLLTLLLAMQSAVKGQAGFELLYWFNDELEQKSKMVIQNGEFLLDVQHLNVGIHNLHLQLKDSCGIVSSPITKSFYKTVLQDKEMKFNYWFDGNDTELKTETITGDIWKSNIDVKNLNVGLHTFYVQATDYCGINSPTIVKDFYKTIHDFQDTKYTCWFDEDYTTAQTGTYNGDIIWLDVSKLQDGFHTLYIQTEQYSLSKAIAHSFIKVPQTEAIGALTCLIFIDDKLYLKEKIEPQAGILNLDIDVTALSQGTHTLQAYVVTPTGAATKISNHFFIRSTTNNEMANLKCFYNIDGDDNYIQAGSYSNGTYHFDLDVALLNDGIHQLNYMLVGSNGVSTEARSSFFVKTPVGGNGIMQYEYWLNDNDSVKTVKKLEERTDPLKLITLLPVESVPIRSSQFHFEVTDGKPMIYAKNTLNMRFYDISARQTNLSREYIDYNVSQEVTDIEMLNPQQEFACPEENNIKWFKFEAEYGDSISLKSSTPVSIEIFNSSGKSLFTTFGSNSVIENGCVLLENGTFYVAIHDVTGCAKELLLESKIIDKFTVFEYAPQAISSIGTTIVYLKGNGLNYVKDFKLYNGNLVLTPDTIVSNRTDLLARFKMPNNVILGKYDMKIRFTDETDSKDIVFSSAIKIEEADRGEVTVDIVTEKRVAEPYPIKVTLKNNGNVGYYAVPVNIALAGADKIDEFEFVNFDLLLSEDTYDSRNFFTYTNNLLDKGVKGLFIPLLLPYIGPHEEQTLVIGVKTKVPHAKFDCYAWAGEPWYDPTMNYESGGDLRTSQCIESNIPDIYDGLDALDAINDLAGRANLPNLAVSPANVVKPFIGAGEAIGGIIQGLTRQRDDAVLEAYGLDPNDPANDVYRFKYRYCARSPQDIWNDANPFYAPSRNPYAKSSAVKKRTLEDYASSSCPNPLPHPVNVYIPGDPNEITGYVAESGSLYMTPDILSVGYDIEFENDPKIANSSAHVIIIENRLDSTKFNLKSFAPKEINLSGRKIELDGTQSFVKTIDLRPEIDALAELSCKYDVQNGIAKWIFRSLDPMTLEITDDIMQGILPVNYDGKSGIGNVTYDVDLLHSFPDGTEISNSASIIFDNNEPILTPVWTNIIDNVKPVSAIKSIEEVSDSTILVNWEGSDEGSGIYRYQLYVQAGENEEWKPLLGDTLRTSCKLRYSRDVNFGFCVLATDSAGNVEAKEMKREFEFSRSFIPGDADKSGNVDILDINATLNHILGNETTGCDMLQMDSNSDGEINLLDINTTLDIILNGNATGSNYRRRTNVIRIMNRPTL